MRFPEGSLLAIGTITGGDKTHQDVYVSSTRAGQSEPCLEWSLPPKLIEVIIHCFQKRAHDARFVNGEEMVDRPGTVPVKRIRDQLRPPRSKGNLKAANPPDGPPRIPFRSSNLSADLQP